MSESNGEQTPKPSGNGRKNTLIKLASFFAAAAVVYGGYWLFIGRFYEHTDNAYVTGNLINIESQIPGTVVAINADETDFVKKGSPLIRLDDADVTVSLEKAKAELAESVRKASQLLEQVEQLRANVALRESEMEKAKDEFNRRKLLEENGAISKEDFDRAKNSFNVAEQGVKIARRQLKGTEALSRGKAAEENPDVQLAKSKLREAFIAHSRSVIVSPVAGYVAKRGAQAGQRVAPGRPLMAIVPASGLRVEANFKENQLANMRIGQPASVTSDMYGSSVTYHGAVAGIVSGTGSVFSLLPPQNATGNWIKIVQRVPVKINLDAAEVEAHPLILGLSMKVEVDTHDRSGKTLSKTEQGKELFGTDVYQSQSAGADELIQKIVSENITSQK